MLGWATVVVVAADACILGSTGRGATSSSYLSFVPFFSSFLHLAEGRECPGRYPRDEGLARAGSSLVLKSILGLPIGNNESRGRLCPWMMEKEIDFNPLKVTGTPAECE